MENGKLLEASSRRMTGFISSISIGQIVEEVTRSYSPGRSRVHTSEMDLEAGVIEILLYDVTARWLRHSVTPVSNKIVGRERWELSWVRWAKTR